MPVSALPSPYGIGTLGEEARSFVDFLARAGQRWWQILPVGPTGYGDSPYQSFSAYAGNPYLIDLQTLIESGLLTREEVDAVFWGDDPARVDYAALFAGRFELLELAKTRAWERELPKICEFYESNRRWLADYALFMAVKRHFGGIMWTQWPDEAIRLHKQEAVEHYRDLLRPDVELFVFIQYLFFTQWEALRGYAAAKGVGIIGDLPIYVSMDSSDVWAEPEYFLLDAERRPEWVAGVPPDAFCAGGQLWGNPLYDWDYLKRHGYDWWLRRIEGASRLYDVLRIDHFRGLESFWAVPFGDQDAMGGHWVKGPGMDLVGLIQRTFPQLAIIAEDLGYLTDDVRKLLEDSGLPGMKVLQFAFDSREPGNYLPHTYTENSTCYTGTHDNPPLKGWIEDAAPADVAAARAYLGIKEQDDLSWAMLKAGFESRSDLFVAQMQDYLGLGMEARMNAPGTLGGNWLWRMTPGAIPASLAPRLAAETAASHRAQPLELQAR